MAAETLQELREFQRFVADKVGSGVDLSPEEAVDEWRRLHPRSPEGGDDAAAIQEALDDLTLGDRGVPFGEFDREFRNRHKLPAQP